MQDHGFSLRRLVVSGFLALGLMVPSAALAESGGDDAAAGETEEATPLQGDIERGEAAYAEDCASCHRSPARFMANVPGDDDEARAAWLDDFLPEHYAPDAQDRADIIAWLLAD